MLKTKEKALKTGVLRTFVLARSTEKDITGFFEKSACDKAFSDFFYFFLLHAMVCDLSCPFSMRTEKDIIQSSQLHFSEGLFLGFKISRFY